MADLALEIKDGRADLVLEGGDLALCGSLEAAVLSSIFSDARAEIEDTIPDGTDDPRGYWADTPDDRWGSRAWLQARDTTTAQTAQRLETAARESLEWMVRDQVAERVSVSAEVQDEETIALEVQLTRSSSRRWAHLWDELLSETFTLEGVQVRVLAF